MNYRDEMCSDCRSRIAGDCGQHGLHTHQTLILPDFADKDRQIAALQAETDRLSWALREAQQVVEAAADLALFSSDCGDNSCRYATSKGGMRTNGGCRCFRDVRVKFETASRNGVGLGSFDHRLQRLRAVLPVAMTPKETCEK